MNLVGHFRGHLVGEDLVRIPGDKEADMSLHPMFLEPSQGAPAPNSYPGKTENDPLVMLSATRTTGIPSAPMESWIKQDHILLTFRLARAELFDPLEEAIRAQFVDRRNYLTHTGLRVIESGEFVRAQRGPSDAEVFTWATEFWFQTYSGLGPREG